MGLPMGETRQSYLIPSSPPRNNNEDERIHDETLDLADVSAKHTSTYETTTAPPPAEEKPSTTYLSVTNAQDQQQRQPKRIPSRELLNADNITPDQP